MKMDLRRNRITELSDYDFLSYLYSERDREESLNSYQGWSIWAIIGAIITVVCVGYGIICDHPGEFNWLRTCYFLSGFLGVVFCYRYLALFVMSFWARKRGVDFQKIKFLQDVAPIPYLIVVLICSVGMAIYFPLADNLNRWYIVSVSWILVAVSYIFAGINLYINRNGIVQSFIDGLMFTNVRLEIWADTAISVVFSVIWQWSFSAVSGPVIDSSEFEIAVCITSIVFLLYMLLTIQISQKKSSHIDVLLDDYIYKNRSKESVYQYLRAKRMGYGVLETCAHELYIMHDSFKNFEPQKKAIEEVNQLLSDGTIDINKVASYFDVINSALEYTDNCNKQARLLNEKLNQIGKQVPNIEDVEEYRNLFLVVNALLKKENEVLKEVSETAEKVKKWIAVYHCKKYGGWCMTKDCPHRNDKKSLSYRIELLRVRFARRFGSIIKPRLDCNK